LNIDEASQLRRFVFSCYYYFMNKFELVKTTLEDAYVLKPLVFKDERGFFLESYTKKDFEEHGISADFVQDNHSLSIQKGVLRGLHFQAPPHTQTKLVRVTKGKVYDVIVDLRHDSETFKKWEGFELSAENFQMLFVPKGFAHGFITLEDNTEFQYKCDEYYNKESEGGIIWNDPDLNIDWHFENPVLSDKDKLLPFLKDFKSMF
jgi:dTDP-4-dehydrorhamnose 3,5-epimerase